MQLNFSYTLFHKSPIISGIIKKEEENKKQKLYYITKLYYKFTT